MGINHAYNLIIIRLNAKSVDILLIHDLKKDTSLEISAPEIWFMRFTSNTNWPICRWEEVIVLLRFPILTKIKVCLCNVTTFLGQLYRYHGYWAINCNRSNEIHLQVKYHIISPSSISFHSIAIDILIVYYRLCHETGREFQFESNLFAHKTETWW